MMLSAAFYISFKKSLSARCHKSSLQEVLLFYLSQISNQPEIYIV